MVLARFCDIGFYYFLIGATKSKFFSSIVWNSLNAAFTLFLSKTDQSVMCNRFLMLDIFSLLRDLLLNSRYSPLPYVWLCICDVHREGMWCVTAAVVRFRRCKRQLYEKCTQAPTERHDGPVEAVLLRKNTALLGRSRSVMMRPQMQVHTDEL